MELWYNKVFANKSILNAKLGYTGLQSENPDGEVSKYVSSHATNLVNGSVNYSIAMLDFGVTGIFKTRKEDYSEAIDVGIKPEYFVANANVGCRIMDNRLALKAEVLNLFDEQYSDILGPVMPGRWFMAGVTLNL